MQRISHRCRYITALVSKLTTSVRMRQAGIGGASPGPGLGGTWWAGRGCAESTNLRANARGVAPIIVDDGSKITGKIIVRPIVSYYYSFREG